MQAPGNVWDGFSRLCYLSEVDTVHGLRFRVESKRERELRKAFMPFSAFGCSVASYLRLPQHDSPATVNCISNFEAKQTFSFLKLHLSGVSLEQQDK